MNLVKEPRLTEYMKIRKQLLNLVMKAGPVPVRLASSRELGQQFGVTHMTVARVMKDLAAEGYLLTKRGVGTFTNTMNNNVLESSNVFGVVIGNGHFTLFDRIEMSFFAAFSDALLSSSLKNWVQHCTLTSALADAATELLQANLSGVVWLMPGSDAVPVLKTLQARGMPLVSVGRRVEGVSSVAIDFCDLGYRIASRMLEQGRKRILLVQMGTPTFPQDGAVAGVEKAYRERSGRFWPTWVFKGGSSEQENFAGILEREKPDGIIYFDSIRPYWKTLRRYQERCADCLLYSAAWELRDDMGYAGLMGVPKLAEAAVMAAENLNEQVASPTTAEILQAPIAFDIVNMEAARGR